ncbi:Carbohydrate binding family 11 [Dehalobacter sp. DCA]|jgi:Beta-mannanase|uniref:glycoside hydrolase family 26 protein n=1 Tax=Dehalobacter sp. DCA TaxID=1147129 RepID=UPI00028B34CF|nr:glycosyl hydrolase [Dehalobacter sp. DCA]AFV02088.1 Carbohydrate binding family 11 [Dehalobacter sp. DCA]
MRKPISLILITVLVTFTIFLSCLNNKISLAETNRAGETSLVANSSQSAESNTLYGAWMGTWPSATDRNIENYNILSNHHCGVIHSFIYSYQNMDDWADFMDYTKEQEAINLLTIILVKNNGKQYSTVDINKGELDAYFTEIAKQLKNWQDGSEIWFQPLYEANGYWFGWNIGNSKINTNETYRNAYQRIVTIFRDNGATNVKFVYNVNYQNNGEGASYMGAYPGDNFVDYVSIDGYNWGTSQSWSKWQTFRQTFDAAYTALTKGSNKPVIITEVASTEKGGSKADWITDMKKQIETGAYPELKAVIWFNDNGNSEEMDWTIDTSESSLAAYQE